MQAHWHDLRAEVGDAQANRVRSDWRCAGLDDATEALLRYGDKLTRRPAAVTAHDVEKLRQTGWSDRAVHDAVQVIGFFNYINRVAGGLGVEPEPR